VIYLALIGVVAGIPIVIFCLLVYMWWSGRLYMDQMFIRRFGTLYENYRFSPNSIGTLLWELVVLSRRWLVILIALLLSYNRAQQYTGLALANVVFIAAHMAAEPFIDRRDNLAETLSLTVLTLITTVLATADSPLTTSVTTGLTVVVYITAVGLLLRLIPAYRRGLLRWRPRNPHKRRQTAFDEIVDPPAQPTVTGLDGVNPTAITAVPPLAEEKAASARL